MKHEIDVLGGIDIQYTMTEYNQHIDVRFRAGYRGRPGKLEPTLDFAGRHVFFGSEPNYDRAIL